MQNVHVPRFIRKLCHNLMKLPSFRAECIQRLGHNEDWLYEAVRLNVNQNDRALYNAVHCLRILRESARDWTSDWTGKTVLELGTSREPGFPLVLLLLGCPKVIANNIFPVDPELPESYIKLMGLMMSGLSGADSGRLDEVIQWRNLDGKRVGQLRESVFENRSPVAAEDLDLPDNSVDFVFSNTVLEHVSKPKEVLANSFRMLKPGGCSVHVIDFRDHRDFQKPLDFLKLDATEYYGVCPHGENRLRAGDFVDVFADTGFEIEGVQYIDNAPKLNAIGSTDFVDTILHPWQAAEPAEQLVHRQAWVTEEQRSSFKPPFNSKSVEELSILTATFVAKKPASGSQSGARDKAA